MKKSLPGALALLLFPMVSALATSFVDRPFPDTVQEASTIVRGKVGASYADFGKATDGSKRIYTYYELQLEEVVKGKASGNSLVMRELGGEKDGVGMHIPGASQFSRGEDVVVMLGDRNADGSYDIRGLMMGKYNIERDSSGKEVLVGPGISGGGHAHEEGASENDQGHSGPVSGPGSKWTLESLRQLVRSQGGAPEGQVSQQNPSVAASPQAGGATPQTPASPAAPRLQTSTPEEAKAAQPQPVIESRESGASWPKWALGIGLIGLGVFAAWVLKRGKR